MVDDPYDLLGVARDASPQHVTEAYRALAQIYHPDRYSEAPPRVQEEAQRRMQALNAAYETLRRAQPPQRQQRRAPAGGPGTAPPPRREPPPSARPDQPPRGRRRPGMTAVLYVDGSKTYHDAAVAPLGLDLKADPIRSSTGTSTCSKLDDQLGHWWQAQTRNASMADKLMYAAWDEQQRALYTATLGCSEVVRSSVDDFASPCRECAPPQG